LDFVLKQRTLIVLILLCAGVAYFIPPFLTAKNLLNVLRQISITGIVAVGMTFVIVTAGIDISVGAIVALGGVVAVYCLNAGLGVFLAILVGLLAGTLIGLLNGLVIAYGRVSPFVTTLGTLYIFRGLTLVVTKGEAFWGLPPEFAKIGTGYLLGIPIPVIIMVLIYTGGYILLKYFTFGRYVLAIGGDEESARLSGVAVKRVKMFTYGLCGLLSGAAGIILAGRLGSAQPSVGDGYELIAIAATVIGGTSLSGGKGKIFGTFLGAIILGVVSNALNLWGVASFYQTVIIGSIVLVAVLADRIRKTSD
jgi:ribose transport system permease protein